VPATSVTKTATTLHSPRFTPLAALTLAAARATRLDFVTQNELALVIEPHAPGLYRLRAGLASQLAEDKPLSPRARAHQELLLARHEAVGEATLASLPDTKTSWRVTQGEAHLDVHGQPAQTARLALYRGETCLLTLTTLSYQGTTAAQTSWQASWPLDAGETLYGLGETTGDLNRRGQIIVSDAPGERALPLLWSPRGWGVYANTLDRVTYALGADAAPDTCVLTQQGALLDLFLFAGEPAEILSQYSQLTGRAGQPPLWAMGLWLAQEGGQSVAATAELVASFRTHQIPLDAVQLAAPMAWHWHDAKLTPEWNPTRDVDPDSDLKATLARLTALDAHVIAPTSPAILAGSAAFAELEDRGWLLACDDGNAHVFPGGAATSGQPYALLDLTHRDVYRLWVERHRQLAEEGLAALACDVQVDIPDGITARGGETGASLRTVYPLLVRQALFDALAGHKTPPEGVVATTDLHPGAQRLPWQGGAGGEPVTNTWGGLAASVRAALSVGASGLPAQLQPLGSLDDSHEAMTPELYLRWLVTNVFSANFAWQGAAALTPWAFGQETLAHAHTWLAWRYRLIPYVLGTLEDAARTGLPVQRAMALAFPADPAAHAWDTQYLLGPALLIAPPTGPGAEVPVYLPKGEAWWDLNTGWRYEGGTTWTVRCGPGQFPVFGREGHMLCLGPQAGHTRDINSARLLEEVWMFGMPLHNPVVMRNKIRVMQMQGSSYIKGLEGLRILPSAGLEIKRRGAEVRISRAR